MKGLPLVVLLGAIAASVAGCGERPSTVPPMASEPTMGSTVSMAAGISPPPVTGFSGGQEIWFIHTEASDPEVGRLLTAMMGPTVLVVPALAKVSPEALADVYVFTNGVPGEGPMGFQPDVFDRMPGMEGYTPLRAVNLVTWREGLPARVLRSVEEIRAAEDRREVTVRRPDVVVNMPVLAWPGGRR